VRPFRYGNRTAAKGHGSFEGSEALVEDLRKQAERVGTLHRRELARGRGQVLLPDTMDRKVP
jgi:hypothetical protein